MAQTQIDRTIGVTTFAPLVATPTPFYQATIFNDLASATALNLSANGVANFYAIQPGGAYNIPSPMTTSQLDDLATYFASSTGAVTYHILYS